MPKDESAPEVVCTLTPEEKADRPTQHWSILAESYLDSEERESGYTHIFEGTDESLVALAKFISNEHECCAFADYTIEISPPYDETRLTITGPDETKDMFDESLIEALQDEL